MITLPAERELIDNIQSSLDLVAKAESEMSTPGWFLAIASQLADRLKPMKCYARGRPGDCAGGECLWDFSAFIEDYDVAEEERFPAQAAVVGEVEWNPSDDEIDHDFEKLLYADSLACFMVFQKQSSEEAERKLHGLKRAVRRRQSYARLRGLIRPPAFLLSCWVIGDHVFRHICVLAASA